LLKSLLEYREAPVVILHLVAEQQFAHLVDAGSLARSVGLAGEGGLRRQRALGIDGR